MKITISLSEEARTSYDPNAKGQGMGYMSSRFLADAFVKRGHDLDVVHPSDLRCDGQGTICTIKTYGFKNSTFYLNKRDVVLSGDVFFVYSLGEERGPDLSRRFIDSLYQIEKQFSVVLNSAESTSYEYKPKQKKLNFPWIPYFDVKTLKELSDIVASGEKIIAKPRIGACGQGVVFLERAEDLKNIENLEGFLFERYIPSCEEKRYIFLDNQCIIRRRLRKEGHPGKEKCTNVDLIEGNERELNVARRIVSSLGMFYAAVDFREEYLLEINGSGTGVAPPTVADETDSYNLSDPIVQAVERKMRIQ